MFNNMDMNNLGEMFGNLSEKVKEIDAENEKKIFTAKSGGGMVKASVNGLSEVIELEIDDSLMEDKESLEILLISAINDSLKMAEDNKRFTAMNMMTGMGNFGAK